MKSQFPDKQFSKEILIHINENYLENNKYNRVKFKDILKSAAKDFGLTYVELRTVLSSLDQKSFKEFGLLHDKKMKIINKAKREIESEEYPKIIKTLRLTLIWSWLTKYFF